MFEQGADLGVGQIRDIGEVCWGCLGEEWRGGIAVDEFEHPAGGEVLDDQGEFGKGQSQELVQLVDEPGALSDDGLESAGDLAQDAECRRRGQVRGGPFGDGKAGGAGLDGIGLVGSEKGGAVVFGALGIAAGDGEGEGRDGVGVGLAESVEEVEEVVGVLAGGVEADDEQHRSLPQGDAFQALAEAGVAGGRLGELQFVGGGLEVVLEEGDVVAVAGRVDSDAAASGRYRGGSRLW